MKLVHLGRVVGPNQLSAQSPTKVETNMDHSRRFCGRKLVGGGLALLVDVGPGPTSGARTGKLNSDPPTNIQLVGLQSCGASSGHYPRHRNTQPVERATTFSIASSWSWLAGN